MPSRTRSSSLSSPRVVTESGRVARTPVQTVFVAETPPATPKVAPESIPLEEIVAREIAKALARRDEGVIIVAPSGTLDLASRVGSPQSNQPSSTSQVVLVDPKTVPSHRPSLEQFMAEQLARFHAENNEAMGITLASSTNNVGNSPSNDYIGPERTYFENSEQNARNLIRPNNDLIRGIPGQNNENITSNLPSISQTIYSSGPPSHSDYEFYSTPPQNNFRENEIGGNPRKFFSMNIPASDIEQQQINYQQRPIIDLRNDSNAPQRRVNQMQYQNDSDYDRNSRNNNEYTRQKKFPYDMMVNQRDYIRTDAVTVSEIKELTIDMNTPLKFNRLRQIKVLLATTNLLTLIDGYRTEPVVTTDNIYGYKPRSSLQIKQPITSDDSKSNSSGIITVILESDDIFQYVHDNKRLYTLIHAIFHKNLHHYITIECQHAEDGVLAYHCIYNHVFGQRHQDITLARNAMNKY